MKKIIVLLLCTCAAAFAQTPTPEQMAQKQLEAYNQKDIKAFMDCFSEDVKIYTYPNTLEVEGKAKMQEQYAQFFNNAQTLHCTVIKRIVRGAFVIDEESVQYNATTFGGVAIYEVKEGKIVAVTFIK
jgi:hypothetical protein